MVEAGLLPSYSRLKPLASRLLIKRLERTPDWIHGIERDIFYIVEHAKTKPFLRLEYPVQVTPPITHPEILAMHKFPN
jgi:hypothetical protein